MSDEQPHNPVEPAERSGRTLWHRLLGKFLELLLTQVAITVQTEVQVTSDPPKVDILLLRRQGDHWTPEQRSLLPDGLRDSRASHLLLECKITESTNGLSFQQALGYDYFYRQAQGLAAAEVQTFVLSARTPRTTVLQDYGYTQSSQPGVYESSQGILKPIGLIVLNELASVPHNAFVQCFASRRDVRITAFRTLETITEDLFSESFWEYVAGLRHIVAARGVTMSEAKIENVITPEMVLETGRKLRKAWLATLSPEEIKQLITRVPPEIRLADLAPEERLAGLAPEERLAGLAPEERLAGLAPEERLAGLAPEERLAGLAPEELETLFRQLEAYLRKQPSETGKPAEQGGQPADAPPASTEG
jgi:hypothetical protein